MKLHLVLIAVLVSCSALFSVPVSATEKGEPYRLRAGDTVLVTVWREETLQKEVRVLPDGSITFPLVGRVSVSGLSTPEVEQRVTDKLQQFITDPEVAVVITGIDGNRVFVLGKVKQPGPVVLTGPMSVLQVLSLAGGLDTFADANAIRVLRTTDSGNQLLPVRYNDLVGGKNLDTNVQLRPGDTILVP